MKMKIKATKTMANYLNKHIHLEDCVESIDLIKVSYPYFVGYINYDTYYAEQYDYNFETGLFNVIKVTYKPECYASPCFLGTYDLLKIYRSISNPCIEDFLEEITERIAI